MSIHILNRNLWAGNKTLNAGLKGTGKTFLAKNVAKLFKTVVYSPHRDEWIGKKSKALYFKHEDFINDFPFFCAMVKRWAIEGKINMVIVDEADLLFKSHFDVSPQLKDLVINHRHWGKPPGLGLIFCTKRPQNLPTQVYGEFENLVLFSVESPQAIELLERYYLGLGDMVRNLDYGSHEFVLKRIGKTPVVMRLEV